VNHCFVLMCKERKSNNLIDLPPVEPIHDVHSGGRRPKGRQVFLTIILLISVEKGA